MSHRRSVRRGWLRRAVVATATLGVALAGWVALPLPAGLLDPPTDDGVVLTARDGAVLRATRAGDGSRQRWVPLAELDSDLLVTFVGAEDRRYYEHWGIDLAAVARAIRQNLGARRVVSGASTISMQVARLVRGSPRTWFGKLEQLGWAIRLDRHLTKQALLEQYLNRVPLGQGAIGVEAAARLYFGASAANLSLGQAALLAGLAHAPSRDNPFASAIGASERRDLVLDRLARARMALPEEIARARTEPVFGRAVAETFLAPHFTTWALARADSGRRRGTIRTSLDGQLERQIESEVRHTVGQMKAYGGEQAAVVVLDNRTGEVLAWVGSPDFFAADAGQVDMVISRRQPGSTLKPFLYGLAFDHGYTPATILRDVATVYSTAIGPYAPRNYDRTFHGPVRIREALGSSYNVPAVELASKLGVAPFLGTLRRAGFASLANGADHYGLGLALGNGDVTLLELANGYRSLANGGRWRPISWLAAESETVDGPSVQVISPEAAAQVIDILADPMARMPAFGAFTALEFPFRAAAKTGTSRHFTDNWAVAVTAGFTVAVWVGNFSGRPMEGASGITGAGPLLQRAVLVTAARHAPGTLPSPSDLGLVPISICRLSGMAATTRCPALTEWFRRGTEPGPDTWFGPDGVRLPTDLVEWANRAEMGNAVVASGVMRASEDSGRAGFRITSPRAGDRYRFVPGVDAAYATIGLRAAGGRRSAVRWFVDGRPQASNRWPLVAGIHRIRAVSGPESAEVAIEVLP